MLMHMLVIFANYSFQMLFVYVIQSICIPTSLPQIPTSDAPLYCIYASIINDVVHFIAFIACTSCYAFACPVFIYMSNFVADLFNVLLNLTGKASDTVMGSIMD